VGVASPGGTSAISIGDLGWEWSQNSGVGTIDGLTNSAELGVQHIGEVHWANSNISNALPTSGIGNIALTTPAAGSEFSSWMWALLAFPSWKATYIWRFHRGLDESFNGGQPSGFPLVKKSIYIGLANNPASRPLNGWSRPPIFIGARFDTDPGVSLPLSSVAAAAADGTTTYTGTIASANDNRFAGASITITGFSNGANNGTFFCVASTATTLVLVNSLAVAETHAGTATTPAISDTTMKLEAVTDPFFNLVVGRNNTQGTVVDTGIVPTEDVYYRLDIICTTAGQVSMSINGAVPSTFTIPKYTINSSGPGPDSVVGLKGQAALTFGSLYSGKSITHPFGPGEPILVSGMTGPQVTLNGNWVDNNVADTFSDSRVVHFKYTGVNVSQASPGNWSVQGYPSLLPIFMFGNDTQDSPASADARICVDYFSFVWNPGVGGGTGTPDPTKSRYF
jgi:hypothetical protein